MNASFYESYFKKELELPAVATLEEFLSDPTAEQVKAVMEYMKKRYAHAGKQLPWSIEETKKL